MLEEEVQLYFAVQFNLLRGINPEVTGVSLNVRNQRVGGYSFSNGVSVAQ